MHNRIESERLNYRFFTPSDLPELEVLLSNPDVCLYLPIKTVYPKDVIKRILEFYVEAHVRDRHQHIYYVTEKTTGQFIGYVGIQMVREFKKYEIFYAYLPEFWGKGYGAEASLRMKQLAKEIGLKDLIALADIQNLGSQKVLKKTGYLKKKKLFLWGSDMFYYEMELMPKPKTA